MDNVIFALGPDGRYLFNAPSAWARNKLPKEVNDVWTAQKIKDFRCASFGEDEDNYFIVYDTKDDKIYGAWGDNTPEAFKEWLLDDEKKRIARECRHIKVTLGPGSSFVAWTPDSIRWSDIPKGLEETLQSWLTPAGWKSGPPRVIALGSNGAYLAMSEYGAWGYSIPGSWENARAEFTALSQIEGRMAKLQYCSMDPKGVDRWVNVFSDTWVHGQSGAVDDFRKVADSFASPEIKAYYENERAEAAEAEKKANEERAKKAREEAARKAAEEKARKEAARKAAEEKARNDAELQMQYAMWLSLCEAAFASKQPMARFPQPPSKACVCVLVSCKVRKQDSGLNACRHDIEALLRASGSYSPAWLRTERNIWHPDRFNRRNIDPTCRVKFQRMSSEIFTIYGCGSMNSAEAFAEPLAKIAKMYVKWGLRIYRVQDHESLARYEPQQCMSGNS